VTLHLGYPTVTQGHWLTGLTLLARPNKAHRSHPCSQNQTNPELDQTQTNHTPLIVSRTIMTVYTLQRLHNFTIRLVISLLAKRLEVSILPNVHFLWCTTKRSPHSLSQRFPVCKTSTLRFHRCGLHHPTEAPSCAKARITPSIT
jgi:predicted Zn-ribbon and HTH transcriptional regulator